MALKNPFLFFFLIVVLISAAHAFDKTNFVKISNHQTDFYSRTEYKICNPYGVNLSIPATEQAKVSFVNYTNQPKDISLEYRKNVTFLKSTSDEICVNRTFQIYKFSNGTEEVRTPCNSWTTVLTEQNYTQSVWTSLSEFVWGKFRSNTCFDVRVSARLKNGSRIDNIISFGGYTFPEYAWWNVSFSYKTNVSINATGRNSVINYANATSFPAMFSLNTASLISSSKMTPNCVDLRILDSDETTLLPYEIEAGTCNTTNTIVWLNASNLNTTTNLTVFVYYGNVTPVINQEAKVFDSSFVFVSHGANGLDSSWTGNNLTSLLGITYEPGQFGNAFRFWANASNVSTNPTNPTLTTFTLECWFNESQHAANVDRIGVHKGFTSHTEPYYQLHQKIGSSDNIPDLLGAVNGANAELLTMGSAWNAQTGIWFHLADTWTSGDGRRFLNGRQNVTGVVSGTKNNYNTAIFLGRYANLDLYGFNGTLDECRVSSVVRSPGWIATTYTQNYLVGSEEASSDASAPTQTFVNQTPSDINSTMTDATIIYNVTDTTGVNASAARLWHHVNGSDTDCKILRNGTCHQGWDWQGISFSNSSSLFTFEIGDSDIYPASYPINESVTEETTHGWTEVASGADVVFQKILNISASANFSELEFMANSTTGTGNLRIGYCNSSYNGGAAVQAPTTPCAQFATVSAGNPYDHCHVNEGNNSCHQLVQIGINRTAGTIGNVKVTSEGWFYFRGTLLTTWRIYNISTVARTGYARITNDSGVTHVNSSSTFDVHVHQFNDSDTFRYKSEACDAANPNNCGNSTERSDVIGIVPLPPSVVVLSPTSGNYSQNISINYTMTPSPPNYISFINISLAYPGNFSRHSTIVSNNSNASSYVWNTTSFPDGTWLISVNVTDNSSLSGTGISEEITIDNTFPVVQLLGPQNYQNQSNTTVAFSINGVDTNIASIELYSSNSLCVEETANVSNTCGNGTGTYTNGSWWSSTFASGIYSSLNLYDGDYSTGAMAHVTPGSICSYACPGTPCGANAQFFSNYTIRTGQFPIMWQVGYRPMAGNDWYNQNPSQGHDLKNISVPPSCRTGTVFQGRVNSYTDSCNAGNLTFSCWTGTAWEILYKNDFTGVFTEEALVFSNWTANVTNFTPVSDFPWTVQETRGEGYSVWNVKANDSAENVLFSTINQTFLVDTQAPSFYNYSSFPANNTEGTTYPIKVTISINESNVLDTVKVSIGTINFTGLPDPYWGYKVYSANWTYACMNNPYAVSWYANDTAGNSATYSDTLFINCPVGGGGGPIFTSQPVQPEAPGGGPELNKVFTEYKPTPAPTIYTGIFKYEMFPYRIVQRMKNYTNGSVSQLAKLEILNLEEGKNLTLEYRYRCQEGTQNCLDGKLCSVRFKGGSTVFASKAVVFNIECLIPRGGTAHAWEGEVIFNPKGFDPVLNQKVVKLTLLPPLPELFSLTPLVEKLKLFGVWAISKAAEFFSTFKGVFKW